MGLLGALEPDDIARIARTVFRAERLELCQPYIFDTCEFGQYAGGSLVEVLVLIDQRAREFHVVEFSGVVLAAALHQKHTQVGAVKSDYDTVHGYMVVG